MALTGAALLMGGCTVVKDSVYDLLGMERAPEYDTDGFDTDWDNLDEELETPLPEKKLDVGEEVAEPSGVVQLERSQKRLPLPGYGGTNMGFRIDKLAEVYALAGAMEAPAWSAPSEGSLRHTRDNDLDTAWTCVPNEEERCAIGMSFPAAAGVHSIRLHTAASDPDEYPRAKRVRVHTERGFTDALLSDNETFTFVEFAETETTRYVIVEVLEVYPGRAKEPRIHIAEFEVFGRSGTAREPLTIDPATTVVALPDEPWDRVARASYERRQMFLHTVDTEGGLHRFMEGTALRGRAGDRLLLVERLQGQSGCDAPRGTFFLLDTKTRITAPLGGLSGVGGDTFRSKDGMGVIVGYHGKLDTKLNGIFVEDGKYRRRQTPIRADQRTEDYFETWSLEEGVLHRSAAALNEPIADCVVGTEALLAELDAAKAAAEAAAPKKKRRKRKSKAAEIVQRPAAWQVCTLAEGTRAFLTDNGPCGSTWEMTLLDIDGGIVATQTGKGDRNYLRVARQNPETLLIEVGDGSDVSAVWRITGNELRELSNAAAFALQPPASCREDCLEPFPNPGAPVWQ
ncbi:MAG: hypothetical protein AAGA54_01000 [Myxococcota bacterium]